MVGKVMSMSIFQAWRWGDIDLLAGEQHGAREGLIKAVDMAKDILKQFVRNLCEYALQCYIELKSFIGVIVSPHPANITFFGLLFYRLAVRKSQGANEAEP